MQMQRILHIAFCYSKCLFACVCMGLGMCMLLSHYLVFQETPSLLSANPRNIKLRQAD